LEWNKVVIKTTSAGVEIIVAMLVSEGISGVEIIDQAERAEYFSDTSQNWDYVDDNLRNNNTETSEASIIFYVGTDKECHDLIEKLKSTLKILESTCAVSLRPLSLDIETVNDQDWLHEWKKHFKPLSIGRVTVVPEWDANHDGDIVFTIDPGSAFGTGQHATTSLCIKALQDYMGQGDKVLDIGCGSGILAIISLLLGAGNVVGCDIDPVAIEVSKKNASLNPINSDLLQLYSGNILTSKELLAKIGTGFDVITANIVADVIKSLSPHIPNLLTPSGYFIASGIIEERLDEVIESLKANHLKIVDTFTSEGWCCVVAHG